MPRVSTTEGLLNVTGGFVDLFEGAFEAFSAEIATATATEIVYDQGVYTVTITGQNLAIVDGALSGGDLTSVVLDYNNVSQTTVTFDQFGDTTLDDIADLLVREQTLPASFEAFASQSNWTILGNSTADILTNMEFSADGFQYVLDGNDRAELFFGLNRFFAGGGDDTVIGGQQQDTLDGGRGNDLLIGRGGSDQLFGRTGADRLDGRGGDDFINGGRDNDQILGGRGNDRLIGASGNDTLNGQDGNDVLVGGSGDDLLITSLGQDRLIGQSGADLFDFRPVSGARVNTAIADFTPGEDTIRIGADPDLEFIDIQQKAWGTLIRLEDGDQVRVIGLDLLDLNGFDTVDGGLILF